MKKLKFEHNLAALVIKGDKTTTWRLFDDKDLTVGDDVELIDKVKPDKPETWKPFGTAHLTKIIEKPIGEINESDTERHEKYQSADDLLETFREYYGSNVTPKTAVKIISFDFKPLGSGKVHKENPTAARVESIKLYADGGSRGNPGPSASGYVLLDMEDNILVDKGVYLGLTTNNQAEYQALKFGLEEAVKMRAKKVDVYMDSLLVINQMKGIFKVRNRDLWPIHEAIKRLAATFEHITFTHVPRELNKLADTAVNRSLDEQVSKSFKKMP